MLVKECMTKKVTTGRPEMTVSEAAQKMRDGDFGLLPIEEDDRLVGMVSDRDIAIRAVAFGKDAKLTKVKDIMSEQVLYCFEDQSLDQVAQSLGDNQIHRMPVLNRQKRLVGILSLSDLAKSQLSPKQLEKTICCISDHKNTHVHRSSQL